MPLKKAVVVDDDPMMCDLIADVLRPRFDVRVALNGSDGLELIRKEPPDLVVLDLLMPRMHGFEVCKKIRADDSLKNVKVLISSSKSYAQDIKTATGAGADMYIVKPFEVAVFLKKVDELMGNEPRAVQLRFWGTRGSVPAPGPATRRYGGNTPCTELRVGEKRIVIDAGTGLRELGQSWLAEAAGKPVEGHIFIGHTHWDHIQGFPFCTPLYLPGNRFSIYGVHGTTRGFEDVLAGQMDPTYFPVGLKEMGAKLSFNELSGELRLGEVKVTYHYLNHPGITVGFRFETPTWTICYISDHEPYGKLNARGEFSAKEDAAVAQFIHGSDLLISEAQYTEEEYRLKKSWGHSTFGDVLGLAAKAEVKKLALFHHDPLHTDEMMDKYVDECRLYARTHELDLECFGAQEGMTLAL